MPRVWANAGPAGPRPPRTGFFTGGLLANGQQGNTAKHDLPFRERSNEGSEEEDQPSRSLPTRQPDSLSDSVRQFLAISRHNFSECRDFINAHPELLRQSAQAELFDRAVQAFFPYDHLLQAQCIDRCTLIHECRRKTPRDRRQYLDRLAAGEDDSLREFHAVYWDIAAHVASAISLSHTQQSKDPDDTIPTGLPRGARYPSILIDDRSCSDRRYRDLTQLRIDDDASLPIHAQKQSQGSSKPHTEDSRADEMPSLETSGSVHTGTRSPSPANSLPMSAITEVLQEALSIDELTHTYLASIMVDWEVFSFLRSQFDEEEIRVESVLTLTGSASHAQATTLEAYVCTNWPQTGSQFLKHFQACLAWWRSGTKGIRLSENYIGGQSARVKASGFTKEFQVSFSHLATDGLTASKTDRFLVSIWGSKHSIVEFVQQLAWTGATLHSSPYGEENAHCFTRFEGAKSGSTQFHLYFDTVPIEVDNNSCWLPLFSGRSIACDYKIPPRQGEAGLEIPTQIMAALIGAVRAVEYDGTAVLKGFSSMAIPTAREGDIIRWHLITNADSDQRLSYHEGLARCARRTISLKVGLDCLKDTRAILGWCAAAESLLGSDDADYEIIDYSGARDAERSLNITGGTLGFQQFGVAQLDFRLGLKDGKCHFQRSGPYQRVIKAAEKTPVVLYDTSDRRGWLVPAAELILHTCHHRNRLEPFRINGETVILPAVGPSQRFASGALLQNPQLQLSDHSYEKYTLKDLVLNIWSLLEFLIDQNMRKEQVPGAALPATTREALHGYEYRAIVDERSPFRMKQVAIAKSSGGWPALVRDIDALALFANGFEDVLRPSKSHEFSSLCRQWQRMPKDKDYLGTTVSMLKDLYDVAGCRLDRKYLTSSHLQWHRGNSILFERCEYPAKYICSCNRLQEIIASRALGQVVPPGPLADAGAVIFGQSESHFLSWKSGREASKRDDIYSLPNSAFITAGSESGVEDGSPFPTDPSHCSIGVNGEGGEGQPVACAEPGEVLEKIHPGPPVLLPAASSSRSSRQQQQSTRGLLAKSTIEPKGGDGGTFAFQHLENNACPTRPNSYSEKAIEHRPDPSSSNHQSRSRLQQENTAEPSCQAVSRIDRSLKDHHRELRDQSHSTGQSEASSASTRRVWPKRNIIKERPSTKYPETFKPSPGSSSKLGNQSKIQRAS